MANSDKPPVIEEVGESKEKKRSYWPWIVVGCVVGFSTLIIAGFVILCGYIFAFCSRYGQIGGT